MSLETAADLPLYLRLGNKRGTNALAELRAANLRKAQESAAVQPATGAKAQNSLTRSAETHQSLATPPAVNGQEKAAENGLSFSDLIDVINPLQHLPVVSTLYREWTGDEIAPAAKVVGGAIYGGPIGAAASLVNAVIEESTGKDIGGHALALLGSEEEAGPQLAANEPRAAETAAAPSLAAQTALAAPAENAAPQQTAQLAHAPIPTQGSAETKAAASGLPSLSEEGWDALLRSVKDPGTLKRPETAEAASKTAPEKKAGKPEQLASAAPAASASSEAAAWPPQPGAIDPLTLIARSLDKYEAGKAAGFGAAFSGETGTRTDERF